MKAAPIHVFLTCIADSHIDDCVRKWPKVVKPYGLCLSVFLDPASFLPESPADGSNTVIYNDVRVDVFLNGEFCGSSFVAKRHHGKAYYFSEHIVRFSGRRVDRMVEKPWVIVPEGQNANGTPREYQSEGEYPGAEPRWIAISEALQDEATRVGMDESGAFSLLGEYLTTLANLEMPPEVEGMQRAGGPKFGVIDVVVIAGKGQKDNANSPNLTKPTALRLKAYEPEVRKHGMNDLENLGQIADCSSISTSNYDEKGTTFDNQSFGHQLLYPFARSSSTGSFGIASEEMQMPKKPDEVYDYYANDGFEDFEPICQNPDGFPLPGMKDLKADKLPHLDQSLDTSLSYSDWAAKVQSCSSLAPGLSLDQNRKEDPIPTPRKVVPRVKRRKNSVRDDKLTLIVKLKLPSKTQPNTSARACSPLRPAETPTATSQLTSLNSSPAHPFTRPARRTVATSKTSRSGTGDTLITPTRRSGSAATTSKTSWSMPPLSEDSVLTYAAGNVVRSIKLERGGWFEEKEVLMGARFLVGGTTQVEDWMQFVNEDLFID